MPWRTDPRLQVRETVESLIREIRGERVILDTDFARVYRVPSSQLERG